MESQRGAWVQREGRKGRWSGSIRKQGKSGEGRGRHAFQLWPCEPTYLAAPHLCHLQSGDNHPWPAPSLGTQKMLRPEGCECPNGHGSLWMAQTWGRGEYTCMVHRMGGGVRRACVSEYRSVTGSLDTPGLCTLQPAAKSGPSPAFVNKVLLEHGPPIHIHIASGCFAF